MECILERVVKAGVFSEAVNARLLAVQQRTIAPFTGIGHGSTIFWAITRLREQDGTQDAVCPARRPCVNGWPTKKQRSPRWPGVF